MNKQIIWLIDDKQDESIIYSNELKLGMPKRVEIEIICPPYRRKEDYALTLENPDTACLIIDQRLKGTGMATYTGIELAQYLRGINTKIPIYILTNYAEKDDFSSGEWSIEYILSKKSLFDEEKIRIAKTRILRHMDVYEDILEERAKRFNELLKKSLDDSLDEAELEELAELQFGRTAPTLAKEVEELEKLERIAKTNEKLINLLSQDGEEESTDAS